MNEIWPSIQIIFEQQELIRKSNEVIVNIKGDLGQNYREDATLIRILNSKTKKYF